MHISLQIEIYTLLQNHIWTMKVRQQIYIDRQRLKPCHQHQTAVKAHGNICTWFQNILSFLIYSVGGHCSQLFGGLRALIVFQLRVVFINKKTFILPSYSYYLYHARRGTLKWRIWIYSKV